ncbi:hypothetical protein L596_014797 [Steinernema carpocapsae]|uniref:DUF4461 domain-containing protein n=1 Tax=Steinernema carpocapsae TaxID=34508 RepID=A0A4U5ND76_STECR|nr:hypothetical protein L596_014797 [Steinernema carpocapsae]
MFSNSPRRILARTAPHSLSRRLLSAQQAQQALRPFYFAVHPDRFARTPEIRAKNEKSLQIFNGYLNELFPNRFDNKTPVEVNFSIDTGNGKLRDVSMSLSGSDPNRIVRMALEKCELSTSHVPEPPKQSLFEGFGAAATFSGPSDLNGMFDELLHRSPARRKRHAPVQTRNLFVGLVRNRDQALKNAESYENTKEALSTEVDFIIHRTGLKEIMWTMNWAHAHMRRSLIGLNRVLDQATPEHRETMIHAMNKRSLRFGRGGSFVCNDGGLQFGADDVPETWQQVCLEANVRRFQLRNLSESRKHLSHLFGGAQIIVANESNLLKTVDQFRSIIVRISARPKSDLKRIRSLSANTVIEITSAYDELALSRNGRLMVPCNVDVTALLEFLEACSDKAREVNKNAYQEQIEVENLKDECCKELNLKSVSWEPEIARDALISCLRRLRDSKEEVRTSLQGLQVLISTNPNVYATADGEVSVPFDWL